MSNFSELEIERVWEKANVIEGYNSDQWRQDFAGAWIHKDEYGLQSSFGWEVDHLVPVSKGGSDDLSNLNPLHWRNNETKSDDTPAFSTSVTSNGNTNVSQIKKWRIR